MFKKILIVLAVLVALFIVIVARQPATYRVERSVSIAAPASVPFSHVNDFHHWPQWSPWEKMDPSMQRTYSANAAGVGATYAWEGNKKVGSGNMSITESRPESFIAIRLEFVKPFKAVNTTEFTFTPEAGGTQVTWAMSGKKNFMSKAICLFMDMDKMVGGDFERGLASLKTVSEAAAADAPASKTSNVP